MVMKINIAASHRFHLLDLARELEKLGHEVRFYSYVPTKRAVKYGLKKENSYSIFYIMIPFLALLKLSNRSGWSLKLINRALDFYLSNFMKPCDFYIALGPVYKNSIKKAQKDFNAVTILEWGNKHIEEQKRILSEIPGSRQYEEYFTIRSIDGYNFADYISIASNHVKTSFIEKGVNENKLLINPYGVDLSMFYPTELSLDEPYDVIMVGGWSYRKGCDLLIEYFKNSELRFLHVGPLVDLPFPLHNNMVHIDAVDQKVLIEYYKMSKIFVLVSRDEGLAMVQSQALICGLPIVCSKNTGGSDLNLFLNEKKWISELEEFNIESLDYCIKKALRLANNQKGVRNYAGKVSEALDWRAYGKRYNENLVKISNF
jgi:starch synthase